MDDSTPIRADVPISLHPDSLLNLSKTLEQPNTLGVTVFAAAREALRATYDCVGRIADAERDLQAMADPALRRQHPDGRTQYTPNVRMANGKPTRIVDAEEFINAGVKAFERVAATLDRRMAELKGYREALAGRVAAALEHPARKTPEGLALASEVRAHTKGLKQPHQRMSFAMDAVTAGDIQTVAAILHAPPYLSGLDAAGHETVRAHAAARFAPVDSAQLEATDIAIAAVMSAGSASVRRMADLHARRGDATVRAARSLKALAEAK